MEEFKSFFKTASGGEGDRCKYPTRLDLYGCGCSHDCSYCYAKSLLDFRKLWNPSDPSVADIQKVRKKIRNINHAPSALRLGGMTDCFQAKEKDLRVTYRTIEALNEKGIPYLIVTKSDLVADDAYMDLMDKDLAHIQISVTTTDDDLAKTYENAPPPSRRIKTIEKLQKAGFDVQLRLSPFIPQYIDYERLADVDCDKILVEFLRVNHWIRNWFDIDYTPYTLKEGGYSHLPLEEKMRWIEKIKGFSQLTVCEDVTDHYSYWKEHVNPNPDDCCNLRRTADAELVAVRSKNQPEGENNGQHR